MNPIQARKAEIRAASRARLATWTAAERERVSRLIGEHAAALICERLPRRIHGGAHNSLDGSSSPAVLVFTPMIPRQAQGPAMAPADVPDEIDPSFLAQGLLERGVRVCVPRVDWRTRAMTCVEMHDWTRDLEPPPRTAAKTRPFLLPREGLLELPPAALGAIIAPGLAFDLRGGRLGRGLGFYDRFIATARAESRPPLIIGVCAAMQIVNEVPTEAHDERVDWVVTEEGASDVRQG